MKTVLKSKLWFFFVLAISAIAHPFTLTGQDEEQIQADQVARHDKYVMHCFGGGHWTSSANSATVAPGLVISHTDLETGDMKFVLSTGTIEHQTRRISYSMTSIVGCVQIDDMLVAVVYHSGRVSGESRRLSLNFKPSEGSYVIKTYSIATGGRLGEHRYIDRDSFPDSIPAATCEPGVLTKSDSGFQMFDEEFRLGGNGEIQIQ